MWRNLKIIFLWKQLSFPWKSFWDLRTLVKGGESKAHSRPSCCHTVVWKIVEEETSTNFPSKNIIVGSYLVHMGG